MAINEKVEEEYKEKWLPIFRERYGKNVAIEEMECLSAGMKGSTYRVLVRNPDGEEGEHYLRLLPGSDDPAMIDGILTSNGRDYVDFWSEYGEVVSNAFLCYQTKAIKKRS